MLWGLSMFGFFLNKCCGCFPDRAITVTAEPPKSPVFIPNAGSRGIPFNTFGETYVFVGKLSGSDKNVLCIDNWKMSGHKDMKQSTFLVELENKGIDTQRFMLVDHASILRNSPEKLSYVISDPEQILTMLELIQASGINAKELDLLKLESVHVALSSELLSSTSFPISPS